MNESCDTGKGRHIYEMADVTVVRVNIYWVGHIKGFVLGAARAPLLLAAFEPDTIFWFSHGRRSSGSGSV